MPIITLACRAKDARPGHYRGLLLGKEESADAMRPALEEADMPAAASAAMPSLQAGATLYSLDARHISRH